MDVEACIEEEAECGVIVVWVARKYRRLSIASTLLTVVRYLHLASTFSLSMSRRNFIFGYSIPKERLAFRQPTDAGVKFANIYTDGHLLIY